VHAGQRVEADTVTLQHPGRGVHCVEGRGAALGHAVVVVNVARAVDREADQETVLLEKLGPVLVEQRAVRLQVVLDPLPGLRIPFLQGHDLAKELEAEQRGLPPLPREHHLVPGHALDIVPDEALEHFVAHVPTARPAGQRLLAQIEAVSAVEIAGRARRLGHDVETPYRPVPEPLGNMVLVRRKPVRAGHRREPRP